MYHVSAQGVDERMINVHYYYYYRQSNISNPSNFFFLNEHIRIYSFSYFAHFKELSLSVNFSSPFIQLHLPPAPLKHITDVRIEEGSESDLYTKFEG